MLKKSLIAAIFALVLATPAPAAAATVKGVVVAKNPLRKAVVVAAPNGSLRTVATSAWKSTRIGSRVLANARALQDGTFSARGFRVTGRVGKARVRAVVVKHERSSHRYLVSGGGSVFSLRYSGRTLAAASAEPAQPGAQILATVDTTGATPQTQQLTQVGQVGRLRVEGIVMELSGSTIKLVVPEVGFVTLTVPAGFDLTKLKVFDQVRVELSVGTGGSFTVLSLQGKRGSIGTGTGSQNDDDDDDSDDSDDDSDDSDDSDDD